MDKKIFSISNGEFGNVFFVKQNENIFVILSEIRRCFNYSPLKNSGNKESNPASAKLKKSVIKMDLSATEYQKFLLSLHRNGVLRRIRETSCIEINKFIAHMQSTSLNSFGKEKARRFLLDNFVMNRNVKIDIDNRAKIANPEQELFKGLGVKTTESDLFNDLNEDICSLKNKFKAMQINLDSTKEQIDAKDKSIFELRAKIKELEEQYAELKENGQGHLDHMKDRIKDLEEQNAQLKSQLENQTKLNKAIGSFVQDWAELNNATV